MHTRFMYADLARSLLPHAFDVSDSAHDEAHLLRVWRNDEKIVAEEGGDTEILVAAALLHDCVRIDKGSPDRAGASSLAAAAAREVLFWLGWPTGRIVQACHAIEAHSLTAGIPPRSLEADILQDADRLDAIGFIGAPGSAASTAAFSTKSVSALPGRSASADGSGNATLRDLASLQIRSG